MPISAQFVSITAQLPVSESAREVVACIRSCRAARQSGSDSKDSPEKAAQVAGPVFHSERAPCSVRKRPGGSTMRCAKTREKW